MKTRRSFGYFAAAGVAVGVLLAAGWHVLHTRAALARLEGERTQARAATVEAWRDAEKAQTQLKSLQREVEKVQAKAKANAQIAAADEEMAKVGTQGARETATASEAGKGDGAGTVGNEKMDTTDKSGPKLTAAEMRELQIQSRVSEQRQRYAPLLDRLGFNGEQQRRFDTIQADWRRAELDESLTTAEKQAARVRLDEALHGLFGTSFDQWVEANRTEPARAKLAQLVQQTFQGSGVYTPEQVAELTRTLYRNRRPGGAATTIYSHDWDRVVAEAGTFLSEPQREGFAAAVKYLSAEEAKTGITRRK